MEVSGHVMYSLEPQRKYGGDAKKDIAGRHIFIAEVPEQIARTAREMFLKRVLMTLQQNHLI